MYNYSIGTSAQIPEKISDKMEQVSFNSVRKTLPDSIVEQACLAAGYKYRKRKVTPIHARGNSFQSCPRKARQN